MASVDSFASDLLVFLSLLLDLCNAGKIRELNCIKVLWCFNIECHMQQVCKSYILIAFLNKKERKIQVITPKINNGLVQMIRIGMCI